MDNFIYKKKWFSETTPTNIAYASIDIGTGDNGVVTVTSDTIGTESNDLTLEVVVSEDAGASLSAVKTNNDILVTLGTTQAVKASINIGSGTNGVVTITADDFGDAGNDFTITVSDAGASGCDMSAALVGTDITVTLGKTLAVLEPTKNTAILIAAAIADLTGVTATYSGNGTSSIGAAITQTSFTGGDDGGDASTVKNTATLIKNAIDAISGVSAVASGNGTGTITSAVSVANFTGGQYATPCREKYSFVVNSSTYYLCTQEGNESDTVWKSFTLTTY